jgi:hypothetical protein
MRRKPALLLLAALLGTAVGCAQPTQITPTPSPPTLGRLDALGPGDVVLFVETFGAMRYRLVTVYADGRVITNHSTDPYRGVPMDLRVRTIGPEAIRRLVTLALEAGVGRDDFGYPLLADGPSTSFSVLTDAGVLRSSVYGLGYDHGLSPAEIDARRPLADLIDRLLDLPATLGVEIAGPESPYEPVAIAAIHSPWTGTGAPEAVRAWPGPPLPGQPLTSHHSEIPHGFASCVDMSGATLDAVRAAAATAPAETAWVWDSQRYEIWFRPLLPEESSCADL